MNSDEKHQRAGLARRAARLFLSAAAALFLVWILASAVVAWKLTHRARPPYAEPLPEWGAGILEEIRLETRDGERLGAWFSPSTAAYVSVLVLHGNGGSRSAEAGLLRELSAEHVPALATTLRAHGDSTGATNDFGWSARADVIASVAFLERRLPGTRIVVLGNSLGAVAAIYASGELGHRVAPYVLEAPYRDIRAAARHRLENYLPHPLDHVAYAGLLLLARPMLPARVDDLCPLDRIADVPVDLPLVFLSGTADRLAPISEVEELRSRCSATTRLVAFPGSAHQDLASTDPDRYAAVLREVFDRLRKP